MPDTTPTGQLSRSKTESTTSIQRAFTYSDVDGWGMVSRTRTTAMTRYVFDTLDNAEAFLASVKSSSGSSKTDGVARRISDNGWAECIVVTDEFTEWE